MSKEASTGKNKALLKALNRKEDEFEPPVDLSADVRNVMKFDRPQFPAHYFDMPRDEMDRFQMKRQLVESSQGGKNGLGIVTATDTDIDSLLKITKARERAKFDLFYSALFDSNDPNQVKLSKELYPDYYESRIYAIEEQLKLQKQIAMIKLMGPQTMEDIHLLYLLSNGTLKVPNGPVWNPTSHAIGADRAYKQGIFNVTKLFGRDKLATTFEQRLAVPLMGNGTSVGGRIGDILNGDPSYGGWRPRGAGFADLIGNDNIIYGGTKISKAPGVLKTGDPKFDLS